MMGFIKVPKLWSNVPYSVARFLESRGMMEEALEVATDPDYRFELAIQLGKLEIAKVRAPNSWKCVVWPLLSSFVLTYVKRTICCLSMGSCPFFLQEIAVIAQSESKWKQLGDLAMSAGMVTDAYSHLSPPFLGKQILRKENKNHLNFQKQVNVRGFTNGQCLSSLIFIGTSKSVFRKFLLLKTPDLYPFFCWEKSSVKVHLWKFCQYFSF